MSQYRGFEIIYDPPPIPYRNLDWQFAHIEYDGPEDHRCGAGESEAECREFIDEIISEGEYDV